MFILIFLLGWIGFSIGLSLVLGGWWIILWVLLGWFVGYLAIVIGLIAHVYLTWHLPLSSHYKNYGWRSAAHTIGLLLFNLRIKVEGREKIPQSGPLVMYANHKSYLDPIIMIQVVKRPSAFTPKSSLFKIPIFKHLMIAMGCMPIYRGDDRKTAKALVKTIKDVENGFVMSVFPEGGRKDRNMDEMVQARAGAYKIAVKPKATILPVTINGNSQIRKRSPWRSTKLTIVIHDPIPYDTYKNLTTSEIADLVLHKINLGVNKKEELK